MSIEENQQNPSCFDDYRKELWGVLKSSHEQFDKAVLTLSGGGLAISLTLVKDFFNAEEMVGQWVLVTSWFLFCGSIILTVVSFLTSQKSIVIQTENFEQFVNGDASYWNKPNPYSDITTWLNRISGGFFLIAVVTTTIFAAINFQERANHARGAGIFSERDSSAINASSTAGYGGSPSATNAIDSGKPGSGSDPSPAAPINSIRRGVAPPLGEGK